MQNIDKQKITEVILYIANKIPECTPLRCMRLVYIADKTHLEKYARFISTDIYQATQHDGALPMYAQEIITDDFKLKKGYFFKDTRQADTDLLSESDTKVLDLVIKLYGEYPMWHLREMAQDKAWQSALDNQQRLVSEDAIACTLDDGWELIEYLHS